MFMYSTPVHSVLNLPYLGTVALLLFSDIQKHNRVGDILSLRVSMCP